MNDILILVMSIKLDVVLEVVESAFWQVKCSLVSELGVLGRAFLGQIQNRLQRSKGGGLYIYKEFLDSPCRSWRSILRRPQCSGRKRRGHLR